MSPKMARDKLKAVLNNIKIRFMMEQMKTGRVRYERGNKAYILQLFQRHMHPIIQLERLQQEIIDRYAMERRQEKRDTVTGHITKLENRKNQQLMPKDVRAMLSREVGGAASCKEVSHVNYEGELTAASRPTAERTSVRSLTLSAWNNKLKRNGFMHSFHGKRHRIYRARTAFLCSKRARLIKDQKTGRVKYASKGSIRKRRQASSLSAMSDKDKYADSSDAVTSQSGITTSNLDLSGSSEIATQVGGGPSSGAASATSVSENITVTPTVSISENMCSAPRFQSNEEWCVQRDSNSSNVENGVSVKTDSHGGSYTSADKHSMTDSANHSQVKSIKPEGTGYQNTTSTFADVNGCSASKTKRQPDTENKIQAESHQQAYDSTTFLRKATQVTKNGCLGDSLNLDDTNITSDVAKTEEDEIKILEVVSLAEYVHTKECVHDITEDATRILPDLIPPKNSSDNIQSGCPVDTEQPPNNDTEPLDLTLGILDLSVKARCQADLDDSTKATVTGSESNTSNHPHVMASSENAYFPSTTYTSTICATNTCQQSSCTPSSTLLLRSTSADANKQPNSCAAHVLFESIEQTVLTYKETSDSCTPVTHTPPAVTAGHTAEYVFPSSGQTVPTFHQTASMEGNTSMNTSSNIITVMSNPQPLQASTQHLNTLANDGTNLAPNVCFPPKDYGNDSMPLSVPPTNNQGSTIMTVSRSSVSHISGIPQTRNIPHCVPVQEFHQPFQQQNEAFQQFNQGGPRFSQQSNQPVNFESRVVHDHPHPSPLHGNFIQQSSQYPQQQQQPQDIQCVIHRPPQNLPLQVRPIRQPLQKPSVQNRIIQQTLQNPPLNTYAMQQSPQNTPLPSTGVQQSLQNQQLPYNRQVQSRVINQPPPNVLVQNIPFRGRTNEPQPQQPSLQNCAIQQSPRKPSLQSSVFQQVPQNISLQSDAIQSSSSHPLLDDHAIKQFPQNPSLQDRFIQQSPQHPSVQPSHRPTLESCMPHSKARGVTEVTVGLRMPVPTGSGQPATQSMAPCVPSTMESNCIKRPPPSYEASISRMAQQHIRPQENAIRPAQMPAIRSPRKPRAAKIPKNTGTRLAFRAPNTQLTTFRCSATTLAHISCNICDKMALFLCSRCKRVAYCSYQCQVAAWKDHAPKCFPQ